MDFVHQLEFWEKGELLQGKIMIGWGILFLVAFIWIFRSQNEFLRGTLFPLALLITVLIGYGGYILQSRPAHAKRSIALFQESREEAVVKEIEKHTNDNKVGKTLIGYVYPSLIITSALIVLLTSNLYYRGMVIGFVLLFVTAFIIDNGFVSRSEQVLKSIIN